MDQSSIVASSPGGAAAAVPAQLGFLAIYNPSLGATDDTMEDQIVYYSSVGSSPSSSRSQKRRATSITTVTKESKEERNERLRQIGLAQGMVEFGRSFSGDQPVDTIETEKSRVVLHELEPGWWILASIDLTRLPASSAVAGKAPPGGSVTKGKGSEEAAEEQAVEYSSREVKPSCLLLQDLLRAHSVFLLHHDSSLSGLFVRTGKREKFTAILGRFWDLFIASWNVMLHGNPLQHVFGAIKIAASGELGVGVGEEDRGSGEREVLEGLVGRIDGLVDLVVGKFGDADEEDETAARKHAKDWLGTGSEPGPEDGAIFLGVGAVSRASLRNISYWMEDLYTWGEDAYGVKESPAATRSRPRRKRPVKASISAPAPSAAPASHTQESDESALLPPPPIVKAAAQAGPESNVTKPSAEPTRDGPDVQGVSKLTGYLKLGYGTYWTLGGSEKSDTDTPVKAEDTALPPMNTRPSLSRSNTGDSTTGHYLIGLMGNVGEPVATGNSSDGGTNESMVHNTRTLLRTLTVELDHNVANKDKPQAQDLGSGNNDFSQGGSSFSSGSSTTSSQTRTQSNYQRASQQTAFDSQDRNKTTRLRVLVYCAKPFIYLFLFSPHTDSLNWEAPYRSLHQQLSPLRKSLLASTAYRPSRPVSQIYDLVFDAKELTIHSTMPHIPTGRGDDVDTPIWSGGRVEALNTHIQLLNTFASTRLARGEIERTAKTSRGWWIVWNRILESASSSRHDGDSSGDPTTTAQQPSPIAEEDESEYRDMGNDDLGERQGSDRSTTPTQGIPEHPPVVRKEIFLIRKSGDNSGGAGGVASLVPVSTGGGWTDGASRLAQGIGVDTRKYIEGLLSLNR